MTSNNSFRKKRTKEELIACILSGANNGASKTHIMYSSYLSFPQLQKYLTFALEAELLTVENNRYIITGKGLEFVRHFEELQKIKKSIAEKRRTLDDLIKNDSKE
ncbi:MAG: winged helix-turn-helix domain-containing protein [Nitrososphaerales archaeon]